ncbi:hypothetical protein ACQRIU_005369 [Beauveria bassiana]
MSFDPWVLYVNDFVKEEEIEHLLSVAWFESEVYRKSNVEQKNNSDIGVIWMLQYGAPDKGTHDAFSKARQLLISAEASWNSSEEMYGLLRAAHDNEKDLDIASKLLLDKTLLEYKLSGCGTISKQDKEAFAKDTMDLENLLAEARSNIAQESGGIWLADEDLQDLPAEELDRIKKHKQPMETPPQEGMTFVPFSHGGTVAVLTFACNPDVRKKMYLADQKKLLRNIPLLRDIVKRRQNLAQRLAYNTHAERRMETRLLKGPGQVKELLDSLSSGLVSRGRREMDMLQKMRLKDLQKLGHSRDSTLQSRFPPWDLKYYQRLVSSSRKVDESAVSEYFPLEYVITQMLQIFEAALGLRFDCIPKTELLDAKIWHNTVTVFSVWDTRQDEPAFMGYLYFDLLWRENKFRGAHNVTMEFGFEKSNGGRKYPSTIVMSAFPTVGDEGCVLLKHHQLITIFPRLPPDFVEIPSLMLENWCWIPQVLVSMSTHYSHLRPEYREKWQREHPGEEQPPKQLPDEIANTLVKYRYSGRGLYHLFQLSISLFDLAIHSAGSAEEAESINVQKLWYDIRERTEGFDFTKVRETGSDLVAFAHLLGGYDMAYYSYLCCSSFAQDLFQSLFAVDPTNTNAWERYRQMVLQPGAEHPDLLKLLEKVLGHAPNATALTNVLENADL